MTTADMSVVKGCVGGKVPSSEQSSSTKTESKATRPSDPLTMRRNGYEIVYDTYKEEGEKGFRTAMLPSVINPKSNKNTLQFSGRNSLETGVWSPCSGPEVVKSQDAAIVSIHHNKCFGKSINTW